MQAIRVYPLAPTSKLGKRWKAEAYAGRATIYEKGGESSADASLRAVKALCSKMGWNGSLTKGTLRDGSDVYAFIDEPVQVNLEPVEAIPEPSAEEPSEPEANEAA